MKHIEMLESKSLKELLELWIEIDKKDVTTDTANVRGWIMDEITKRHPDKVDQWLDDEMEKGQNLDIRNYFNELI